MRAVGNSAYSDQSDKVVSAIKGQHPEKIFAIMKSMMEICFKKMKHVRVLSTTFCRGSGTEDMLRKVNMVVDSVAVLIQ